MVYHVYVEYTTRKGTPENCFLYNFPEAKVRRAVAAPYMEGKPILVHGEFVHPSKIDIFESEKSFLELILPNGKSPVESKGQYIYRCFGDHKVKGSVRLCTHDFITSPPKEKEELRLMDSATFLGLDKNWSLATCALQLQEIAVTLMAKRKNIKLDKANVERILNKNIKDTLSFNDQYQAFSRQIEASFNIEMPRLTAHLRRMRTEVLHEGYNPTPEETESIVGFTIGLLRKLKDMG